MATAHVAALFRRRWIVPVLAELSRRDGAKFVTLAHATGASAGALRATLDELRDRGWVLPNPGYGHPLRPEYVLSAPGARVAGRCVALDDLLHDTDVRDVALRRWPMPVLHAIGRRRVRFSVISGRVGAITDRALSLSLQDLTAVDLVERRIVDDRPPVPIYAATGAGRELVPALQRLG
jgi:DNA-binding HxlR family transcriptional regulator